ncbi:MAG: deoxyribodipyrimidine photo-lyase [Hyphomicrobiales bacterium]
MAKHASTLLLFRADLRVLDNAALTKAVSNGGAVTAVFVLDDEADRAHGGASRWWLHHSLASLTKELTTLGISLILRRGTTFDVVKAVQAEIGATHVYWNRSYDKYGVALGRSIKDWAASANITAQSFDGALLHEPFTTKTKSGTPFKVFTPFWKSHLARGEEPQLLDKPEAASATKTNVPSDKLEDWHLLPTKPDWSPGFEGEWQPGGEGAEAALETFFEAGLMRYQEGRDVPSIKATSKLSSHLRFGEITPARIWHKTKAVAQENGLTNADKFLAEIGWREFSHHLLFHNPDLQTKNFNVKFNDFPWYDGSDKNHLLKAWQTGQTGYPIVDAGMRQLWQTGWMHNRVRMIVGSFLVKHLLLDWREGEAWFWDTLVDACPASNTASWQWIAGCGADAAPYFRIFNPILQGEKFDKQGVYVRKFVPELSKLPAKIIHKPWEARSDELAVCGVTLGRTYPKPIVNHAFARDRALQAFQHMKQAAA